jgi:hypothetical protein
MLFFKKVQPRRFAYHPRYYKESEDREHRIKFRRITSYDPHTRRNVGWILLVAFIVVLMLYLFGPTIAPYLRIPHKQQEVTIDINDVRK